MANLHTLAWVSVDSVFFIECSGAHRDLHSFPTRRSSDLRSLSARTFSKATLLTSASRRDGMNAAMPPIAEVNKVDRKSTRLNSSHSQISYAVFCLKKKMADIAPAWRPGDLRSISCASVDG